jgi:predicted transcriptional regulator
MSMSVIVIDGDQSVKLSRLSLSELNRIQMEHKILSVFFDRRKLTVKEICDRMELPFSTVRNHLSRMVKDGSLKKTKTHVENYNLSWYEVV